MLMISQLVFVAVFSAVFATVVRTLHQCARSRLWHPALRLREVRCFTLEKMEWTHTMLSLSASERSERVTCERCGVGIVSGCEGGGGGALFIIFLI